MPARCPQWRLEAVVKQTASRARRWKQQIFLVAKVDVHQGARTDVALARHLIDRSARPSLFRIQGLGGVENLGAAPFFFFPTANGYIGHECDAALSIDTMSITFTYVLGKDVIGGSTRRGAMIRAGA